MEASKGDGGFGDQPTLTGGGTLEGEEEQRGCVGDLRAKASRFGSQTR